MPGLHTVHGGITTAEGPVGTGAAVVVEGALQFGITVAGSGPPWSGLHPGSFSKSTWNVLRKRIAGSFSPSLTLAFGNFWHFSSLLAIVHAIGILYR